MIDHNHFICHLILGTFTEYPYVAIEMPQSTALLKVSYTWCEFVSE